MNFKKYNFNSKGLETNNGSLHPLMKVKTQFREIMLELGFEDGPVITWSQGNIRLPFAMALPLPPHLLPVPVGARFRSGFDI